MPSGCNSVRFGGDPPLPVSRWLAAARSRAGCGAVWGRGLESVRGRVSVLGPGVFWFAPPLSVSVVPGGSPWECVGVLGACLLAQRLVAAPGVAGQVCGCHWAVVPAACGDGLEVVGGCAHGVAGGEFLVDEFTAVDAVDDCWGEYGLA